MCLNSMQRNSLERTPLSAGYLHPLPEKSSLTKELRVSMVQDEVTMVGHLKLLVISHQTERCRSEWACLVDLAKEMVMMEV